MMSEYGFISVWIWHNKDSFWIWYNKMKNEIHMIEPTTIVSEYHSIVSGFKSVIMRLNNVWP